MTARRGSLRFCPITFLVELFQPRNRPFQTRPVCPGSLDQSRPSASLAAAARLYPKVLAFWGKVLEGTATCERDGKRFLKYTTDDRFEATRMIMAYGVGKPVQLIAGVMQETQHRVLEVRWMPPRADDHSKCVDLQPGE